MKNANFMASLKAFFGKAWTATKAFSIKAGKWIVANKLISIPVAVVLVGGIACAIALPIALHEHDFATEWSTDADNHWHSAICSHEEEKADFGAHVYDNACDTTCNTCGATRTVGAHVYDNACDTTCNTCGATRTVGAHVYDNACDTTCNTCGATRTVGAHAYDNACDTTCNVCGATRAITHDHADTLTVGDTTHYYLCSVCGDKKDEAVHTFDKEVASDDYYVSNDLITITYNKSCVCGAKGTDTFAVNKPSAALTVNIADKVYDGQQIAYTVDTNSTGSIYKYFYKWDGTEWQMLNEALTKNVGEYKIKVIVYSDATYKATEVEEEFEVTKKVLSLPSEIEKTYDGTNVVAYNFDTTATGTGEALTVKVGLMEGTGYTPIKNVGTYTADFSGDVQFDEPHFFVGGNEVENYDLDSAFWGQTGEYEITINKKVIGNLTYNTTYQANETTNGIILTLTSTHGVASGEYLFIKIDADDVVDYSSGQTYDLVLSESDAGNGKLVAYLSATNDNYIVDIETIKLRVS